ncbi:MAG: hypothetical protein PHU93_02220 [Candidatus Gracilibacteria bacterium]|nr:hypothetical protein [Candidatus Gracilibacteria bacterium]
MKPKSQIFLQIVLLIVAAIVLYWKFFALSFIPVDSSLMDTALRYMQSRIAVSWVDFYRGNQMFKAAQQEKNTNLSGSIQKLDIAIEYYLSSLNGRETREARENLEVAQKEYKKLKEDLRVQERLEKEEEEEEQQDTKQDVNSGKSNSGSGTTGSGSNSEKKDESKDSGKKESSSTDEPEKSGKNEDGRADNSGKSDDETGSGSASKTQDENSKKDGPLGYTNTGTFFEGFSGSMSGTGLSTEDEQKLKGALNGLKELQNQKGDYTRPNGIPSTTDGMGGLFEKYFGNSSLFGNERDNDPYDY